MSDLEHRGGLCGEHLPTSAFGTEIQHFREIDRRQLLAQNRLFEDAKLMSVAGWKAEVIPGKSENPFSMSGIGGLSGLYFQRPKRTVVDQAV